MHKLHEFKDEVEKVFIEFMLKKNDNNISKTATELDIQRSHLYNKIHKYDIHLPGKDDQE